MSINTANNLISINLLSSGSGNASRNEIKTRESVAGSDTVVISGKKGTSENDVFPLINAAIKEKLHNSEHEDHSGGKVHKAMNTAHKGIEIQHASHVGHAVQGHEVASNMGEAAKHVTDCAAEGAQHAGEIAGHTADAAGIAHGANAHEAASGAAEAADLIETSEVAGSIIANAGYIGSGVVGAYFLPKGIKNMTTAIKTKNTLEGIEAGGEIALGTAGMLNFGKFASQIAGCSVQAAMNSPLVAGIASGLGVVHGAADIIVGGKQIYDGIKIKDKTKIFSGSFDVGIGISIGAIALGGGIPAAVGLGVAFLGKTAYKSRGKIKKAGQKIGNAATGAVKAAGSAAKRVGSAVTGVAGRIVNKTALVRDKTVGMLKNAISRRKNEASENGDSQKSAGEPSDENADKPVDKKHPESIMFSGFYNDTFM